MAMSGQRTASSGFTIVELLIVIVVIAILAAITVVAFNGVQGRARDAQRVQDLKSIVKALEIYKVNTGDYPLPNSTMVGGSVAASGWEVSTFGSSPTDFLAELRTSGTVSKVPVDPVNIVEENSLAPHRSLDGYEYFYYRYSAGDNSCPVERGNYYVLGAARMDSVTPGQNSPQSPGFACGIRDWAYEGAWVIGGFVK